MLLLYIFNACSGIAWEVQKMTIRHLRIFLEVYRTGNVTRASENLNMTQPTVTRAIQELEKYYGVRLFERIKGRLLITGAGERLYPQALHITDSFDAMEKGLRTWDETGVMRVGASITLGNVMLPRVVSEFRTAHPAMRVEARVANGALLQAALLENALDIALIEGSVESEDLTREPFNEDRLVLILPPDDPRARAESLCLMDLRGDRFILREHGSVGRSLIDHVFAVRGVTIRPVWESVSTGAILNAVSAGLGISFLPENLARREIAAGSVATRMLDDEPLARSNYIVWHKNKYLPESAREFIALCREWPTKHGEMRQNYAISKITNQDAL